jgi:large subunit ribosomal protein L10
LKRADKKQMVQGLHEKLSKAKAVILTDFRGLNTSAMNELRNQLREASVEYRVVKNTLVSRASDGTDMAALKDHFFGPSAVALSYDDPIVPAKVLTKFGEQYAALEIRAGIVDGKVVHAEDIKRLAKLPSWEGVMAQLLSVLNGPARSFLTVLNGVPRNLVAVLHAIKEKKASA